MQNQKPLNLQEVAYTLRDAEGNPKVSSVVEVDLGPFRQALNGGWSPSVVIGILILLSVVTVLVVVLRLPKPTGEGSVAHPLSLADKLQENAKTAEAVVKYYKSQVALFSDKTSDTPTSAPATQPVIQVVKVPEASVLKTVNVTLFHMPEKVEINLHSTFTGQVAALAPPSKVPDVQPKQASPGVVSPQKEIKLGAVLYNSDRASYVVAADLHEGEVEFNNHEITKIRGEVVTEVWGVNNYTSKSAEDVVYVKGNSSPILKNKELFEVANGDFWYASGNGLKTISKDGISGTKQSETPGQVAYIGPRMVSGTAPSKKE